LRQGLVIHAWNKVRQDDYLTIEQLPARLVDLTAGTSAGYP